MMKNWVLPTALCEGRYEVSTTWSSFVSAVSSSSLALEFLAIMFPTDLAAGALATHVVLPWPLMAVGSILTNNCSVLHQFLEWAL